MRAAALVLRGGMTDPSDRERLSGLLNFAADSSRPAIKPSCGLSSADLAVHEKEINGLPAIRLGSDKALLAVEKPRPTDAPSRGSGFEWWIVGDLNDPARARSTCRHHHAGHHR